MLCWIYRAVIFPRKHLFRVALGLGIFVAVLAAAGHWLLPIWLKSFASAQIQQATGRSVRIDRIEINPFTLTLRIDGLTLFAVDGRTAALHVDELYADLSASSLFHRALVIDELRIQHPQLAFSRLAPQRFSFSDIVERLRSAPASPKPAQPLRFALYNIQIDNGQIDFDDRVSGRQHHVDQLKFSLPFISDTAHAVQVFVRPQLSASINGSLLDIKGRSKPFAADHETDLDIDLDALDIPTYLGLVPAQLDYTPTAGRLDSRMQLSFRQPENSAPQVTLQGQLKISGLRVAQRGSGATLQIGQLDLNLGRSQLMKILLAVNGIDISDLHIVLRNHDKPALAVTRITLADARYDGSGRSLRIGSLQVLAPNLALHRGKDGRIDLLAALTPPAAKVSAARPASAAASPQFKAIVGALSVKDGHLVFDDAAAAEPVHLDLRNLEFSAQGVSTDAATRIPFELSGVAGKGRFAFKGGVAADPFKCDLDIDVAGLDPSSLQGYFSTRLNVYIQRLDFGTRGRLALSRGRDAAWQAHYDGKLNVDRLALRDKLSGQPFLNWKTLDISKIDLQYPARGAPFQLLLGNIALSDFYARVIVNANARLNLQDVVASGTAPAPVSVTAPTATAPAPAPATSVAPAVPTQGPQPRIRLGRLTLNKGRIGYTDNYVKPNYSANLTSLTGSIGRVASDRPAPAPVALTGRLDGDGTLEINGEINPLASPLYLDLAADARDIELTRLTPYAAKYAGYAIDKGKLSVNVKYHVENQQLQAQNHVFLDQLTFGQHVDSPEATHLPVLLAVALLKDRNGVIDVNLPVSGSLSDPEFSLGGVILRVVVNLLEKAVTSPFALLGSAFGGGDELGYVEFAPGLAMLSDADRNKLDKLAKALADRPALKLDISGRVDPATDADGLRHEILLRNVRYEKVHELGGKDDGATGPTAVSAAEYPKYLLKVYGQGKFPKPRNALGFARSLPPAEMEKLILANTPVDDGELRDLAMRRATVVRDYLTGPGKVSPARLFLAAPHLDTAGIHDQGKPNRVDFLLK
ncbi:MAG: DUF748 domain-containing protein [Stenotrophobium sp.]